MLEVGLREHRAIAFAAMLEIEESLEEAQGSKCRRAWEKLRARRSKQDQEIHHIEGLLSALEDLDEGWQDRLRKEDGKRCGGCGC